MRAEGREDHLTIRVAKRDEFAAVGRLTRDAYTLDYPGLSPGYVDEMGRPELREQDYELWVAEEPGSGELLATVSVLRPGRDNGGEIRPGELYFRLLAVAPKARRRGLGARLTLFTLELARERGLDAVVLHSGPEMLPAHALYTALGFRRAPERERSFLDDSGRELHLLTFVRPLDSPAE